MFAKQTTLLLLVLPALAIAPGACASASAWRLEQSCSIGTTTLFVTPKAIKATDHAHGYSILAKAPDWTVIVFRDDEKVETIMPLDVWYHKGNRWFFNNYAPNPDIARDWEPIKYAGIKAYRFCYSTSHKVKAVKDAFEGIKTSGYTETQLDFITTDAIPASLQVQHVIQGFYCCPVARNVLLAQFIHYDNRPTKARIDTVSAVQVPVTAAMFSVPAYRKVSNQWEVLSGKSRTSELNDIFDSMGVGSSGFGNKPQQHK